MDFWIKDRCQDYATYIYGGERQTNTDWHNPRHRPPGPKLGTKHSKPYTPGLNGYEPGEAVYRRFLKGDEDSKQPNLYAGFPGRQYPSI